MAPHHASVLALLLGVSLLCVPPASAQARKPQGPMMETPPVIPAEFLPDLVVSAKATVKCTANGKVAATIIATVKNQSPKGTADMSKIPWQILVEADWAFTGGPGFLEPGQTVKPQLGGPKTLKPGESWVATLEIVGIPKVDVAKAKKGGHLSSQYAFWATVDPLKGVAESNETNNKSASVYLSDPCQKP